MAKRRVARGNGVGGRMGLLEKAIGGGTPTGPVILFHDPR